MPRRRDEHLANLPGDRTGRVRLVAPRTDPAPWPGVFSADRSAAVAWRGRNSAQRAVAHGQQKAMTRASYPTDLTDAQWARIAPLLPPAKTGGRPRDVDLRAIVNAALYRHRGGCSWRLLPHAFPPWQTVYTYVRQWQHDGTWDRLLAAVGAPIVQHSWAGAPGPRRGRRSRTPPERESLLIAHGGEQSGG